jgi:Ca2+-binding RTX toxin-like protein
MGNDTYVVDNAKDVVTEAVNQGYDRVQSSVSYLLAANVEAITLTGTASINATGNTLANDLTGNSAANTLNGKTGVDRMAGGAGDDIYLAYETDDVVIEFANEGTDVVKSAVSYTLSANVENLTLTIDGTIDGTGNELANAIDGNGAANYLRGLDGNDSLGGFAGNDTLQGGAGDDRLLGSVGADTYLFARGDGQDLIIDIDTAAGVQDVLRFGAGISADQLWMRKVSANLEVSIIGTTDRVTISGWYSDAARRVEVMELADGRHLMDSQVQNIVEAMTALAPPAVGQMTLPADYQVSLVGVIAGNWL